MRSTKSRGVSKEAQQAQYGQSNVKTRDPKRVQNTSFKKERNRSGQRPPRSGCGTYHGQCWGTHGRAPLHFRVLSFFARLFVFPCAFSVCTDVLALKEACTWPIWGVDSQHTLSHTLKTPLKKKKVEEEGSSKGDVLEANRKIDVQVQHKLSHLLFLLPFCSFLVRNFDMFNLLVSIMCEQLLLIQGLQNQLMV